VSDYIWGQYTILILPPTFPYGGMENPLLTFASPTIITGIKSQTYVAVHEIMHSWTGNTVTYDCFSNEWINEGFTVFLERKVNGILNGDDFSKVNAALGNKTLYDDMASFGFNNSFSSLHPDLDRDVSADDTYGLVSYEKGF